VDRNIDAVAQGVGLDVALLAEGVDRNLHRTDECGPGRCRPPRGGRG